MKYKIEHSLWTKPLVVILPELIPSVGVAFEIEIAPEGESLVRKQAMLLADGLSLKVEHDVIRFRKKIVSRKQGHVRVDASTAGSVLTPHDVVVKVVRPVEPKRTAASLGGGDVKSPMTGKVLQVLVNVGDTVEEEQDILTIEAMKMENRIKAECAGTIKSLKVQPGQTVNINEILFHLEPAAQL